MARLTGPFVLALLVAACASPVSAPGGSDLPTRTGKPQPEDRIHAQAHDALARWADAVRENGGASISFVGDLTSQIGDWEEGVADNNKRALATGQVIPRGELPSDVPGRREVKWVDGTKLETQVLSASAALVALVEEAGPVDCDGCDPIVLTGANLATGLVETATGPAEVPMWVYAVEGSAVRVTRVAVDGSVTVRPPAWNESDPPLGLSIDRAIGTPDSETLEVEFVGSDDSCGLEYTAEAVESQLAVAVIVSERPGPDAKACRLIGVIRTATVPLEGPLGSRAVLEVRQGLPVPVHAPS